jgi:hypothetical protein
MISHLGIVHVVKDGVVELGAVSFEESVELAMWESWWGTCAHSDISWHVFAVVSNWVLEIETGLMEDIVDVTEIGIEVVVGGVLGE